MCCFSSILPYNDHSRTFSLSMFCSISNNTHTHKHTAFITRRSCSISYIVRFLLSMTWGKSDKRHKLSEQASERTKETMTHIHVVIYTGATILTLMWLMYGFVCFFHQHFRFTCLQNAVIFKIRCDHMNSVTLNTHTRRQRQIRKCNHECE